MFSVFQNIGGTVFITSAQTAFVNTLLKTLPRKAPNVDPHKVVATGATDLRKVFSPADVTQIIQSYMAGIRVGFAIAIGATGVALLVSMVQRWERINQAPAQVEEGVIESPDANTEQGNEK